MHRINYCVGEQESILQSLTTTTLGRFKLATPHLTVL